ncbi:MAG TPA: TIGR03067 domain-containing protein [Gemmataceae bacterium]|nr:TIGR03067 domain-containing protein [Gemmataceae bacterium]
MATGFTIFLFPIFVCCAGDEAKAKKELAELQGSWALTSVEREGKAEDLSNRYPPWVIKGNKVFYGGEEVALLAVDPTTKPKCIDISFPPAKNPYEGIFLLEENSLKICINKETEGPKQRPGKFSTMEKPDWRLLQFKRGKEGEWADFKGTNGFIGMAVRLDQDKGEIIINEIFDNSPAKKSGLEKDDTILKAGDAQATDLVAVVQAIRQTKPGSDLTMKIKRKGKEMEVKVKVGIVPFRFIID